MSDFTPGPWNVQIDGQVWCDNHPVVEKLCSGEWGDVGVDFFTGEESLVHCWGTVATDEANANARLIAAAPELYEALAVIVGNAGLIPDPATGESTDCYAVPIDDIEAAIAALAKARGEA